MLNLVSLVSNTSYILAARRRCPVRLVDVTVAIVASLVPFRVAMEDGVGRYVRKVKQVNKNK